MKVFGVHIMLDGWGSPFEVLNDEVLITDALHKAIKAGRATLIHLTAHQFSPHGVTATATLAESHISIHTWPEENFFAADLFFCGEGNPHEAMKSLEESLKPEKTNRREINRGTSEDLKTI